MLFQPTHPSRGATSFYGRPCMVQGRFQPTHPSRGATIPMFSQCQRPFYFNPRTPHGVRLAPSATVVHPEPFQPTHPSRGATPIDFRPDHLVEISTHAPLTGCDTGRSNGWRQRRNFNPRTPHGVRPLNTAKTRLDSCISTHAPLTGCDLQDDRAESQRRHFNPRTPHGVRPDFFAPHPLPNPDFNPRTPHGVRHHRQEQTPGGKIISTHAPLTGCDALSLLALARCA